MEDLLKQLKELYAQIGTNKPTEEQLAKVHELKTQIGALNGR